VVKTNSRLAIGAAIVVLLSVLQGVSADRTNAVEETILIDSDDADVHFLLTESGTPVEIWIDDIDGANGGSDHPIDVYIATWEQWWNHSCGGEGNQFAAGVDATATITITDFTELNAGDKVNLVATDGTNYNFSQGDQSSVNGTWESTISNNQTATNLMNVINTSSGPSGTRFTATVNGAVVTVTQAVKGIDGNTTVTLTDSGTAGMNKTDFIAEEFTPAYVKENVDLSSGETLYIEWTPQTDDDYYLLFDNCDNQRTSDYKADVSSVIVSYAVDDLYGELGEGMLAFLGGSMLVCCGIPLLLVIIIIGLLFKRKREVIVIHRPPSQQGY